jgi:hypothetical protein
MSEDKQQYCAGCRDDFYNHRDEPGFDGATKCWSLKDAEVVTRYRIHWWTAPTNVSVFQKVKTLDCHHEPGQFAFFKELPEHLREGVSK